MNKLLIVLSAVVVVTRSKVERDVGYLRLRNKPPGLSEIDAVRLDSLKKFQQLWQDLSESNDINQKPMQDLELLRSFQSLNPNFTLVENSIDKTGFFEISTVWSYAKVDGEVTNINSFYETFIRFQNDHFNDTGMRKPPLAWTDLAQTYLQNTDVGVMKSLEKIHRETAKGSDGSSMFLTVLKEMKSNTCNLQQSPQQVLYNLYTTVALADLKGYTMLQFSYMLLKLYQKGNFTIETELAKSNYEQRTLEKINAVRAAMSDSDRGLFKCDPKQYVEGVNYVKLTKLLQGYIENEVNLNRYGTCRENCAYYDYTEYNGCFKDQFCAKQNPCHGKVVECRYIDSDMNICKSSDPNRRYDWIEYENGRVLGNKGTCQAKNLFKVDSWWRYLFWHCSYCFCYCDENHSTSDRYFNLREVTSDIERNRVITGVRLVKNNQIIHLQIQEGVLTERGLINQTSLSWKPVDNYSILDHDVVNNRDYHTMNWRERTVDIDDAFGPAEHVLTGVRFRKIGTHLNIEIRTTPFNFTTGELFTAGYSFWVGNDNTEASQSSPRKKIELTNPDIPLRKGPHSLDSKHDQYIVFQATSMDTDAAQSTVPFLDSQALTSHGFPLSGVGLVHRGKQGSGGFLAPKLITYDFSPHLIPQFPVVEGRNV